MLAFAMMAVIRYRANDVTPQKDRGCRPSAFDPLVHPGRVRRIANKLAQRRIKPAYVIAWSCWRRAHQATARRAHLKSKSQLSY
jgi:hypothetical protein